MGHTPPDLGMRLATAAATMRAIPHVIGGLVVVFGCLPEALAIPTPEIAQSASGAGGASGAPSAISACDPREPNWRSILETLARTPGDAGIRQLGEVVRRRLALAARGAQGADGEDSDPRLRDALSLLGGKRGSSLAAGLVAPALEATDAGVRYAAVEALGAIGCACSRTPLSAALANDREPLVAAAALGALARLGALEHSLLMQHVTDERAPVRSAAARALVKTGRSGDLRSAPAEATEVHALRLLTAAHGRRPDLDTVREFVHPMRRLEVWEEGRSTAFSARTITPAMLRQEIAPPLARASELADSLTCGPRRAGGEQRCAVYDAQGYVTEMHFTAVLGQVFLLRVKHHGGYADL